MRVGVACLGLLATTACQFDRPPNIGEEDARVIDAAPTCVDNTTTCDDDLGVYTECGTDGFPTRQLQCPLGCASDEAKCLDIDPSNGLATYFEMTENPPDVTFSGSSFVLAEHGGAVVTSDGLNVVVPWFEHGDFAHDGLIVLVVHSLTVDGTLRIPRTSDYALPVAILATGDITIRGTIDISSGRDGDSAAGQGLPSACYGRSGQFAGNPPDRGGGGGGGVFDGARGAKAPYALGGNPISSAEPLRGGCAGGFGGRSAINLPGAGGGAIQLTSRTIIRVEDTGIIDASGGGATYWSSGAIASGSGGGGGGTILLEAPDIVLDGAAVVLSTKGGGGAGAGTGPANSGADGGTDAAPSAGGTTAQTSKGGAGGTGMQVAAPGQLPKSGGHEGGGGGGSVGLTALHTRSGVVTPLRGAAIYSLLRVSNIRTRRIP